MIVLARTLARIVGFLVCVVLALGGLLLAVFTIGTGTHGPSLGGLARLLSLHSVRDTVGPWLARVEAPGSVAVIAGVCGVGAIALGLLLIAGVLVPRRERLVQLAEDERGKLAARREAVGASFSDRARGRR